MDVPSVGLLVAFSAGLLSFLSPCVLPLVPSYVTFITGLSLEDVQNSRRTALVHGFLFVLGFSAVFVALGALATVLGQVLLAYRDWIARIGGVVIVVFGLYLMGVLNLWGLAQERRVHLASKPMGYLGTVVVGIAFGAGWTPCIGPILGSILVYASSSADVGRGTLLLAAYALGLAIPFMLSAVAVQRFFVFFQRIKRQMTWLSRATGLVMVGIGFLLLTNRFTYLAGQLNRLTPSWLLERL